MIIVLEGDARFKSTIAMLTYALPCSRCAISHLILCFSLPASWFPVGIAMLPFDSYYKALSLPVGERVGVQQGNETLDKL